VVKLRVRSEVAPIIDSLLRRGFAVGNGRVMGEAARVANRLLSRWVAYGRDRRRNLTILALTQPPKRVRKRRYWRRVHFLVEF